jgi:hypothetical protein
MRRTGPGIFLIDRESLLPVTTRGLPLLLIPAGCVRSSALPLENALSVGDESDPDK